MITKQVLDTEKGDFATTREAAGSCHSCHYLMPSLVDCSPLYFRDGFVRCDHCGEQVDLWQVMVDKATKLSIAPGWALASLGAGQTSFVMSIETGRYYQVELTTYDVPADAKILTRNYTGQGGDVTAMEWHTNAPPLRFPGTVLRLVGVPLGEGPLPRVGRVAINVVWIRNDESNARPYLVTAFEAAAAREYAPALVFAQSAVEITMMPQIEQRLRRHSSAKHVKNFMRDSLTYSYALNVVLPYLCGEAGIPQMPLAIRSALNKMRKRRNDIIHKGANNTTVAAPDVMEALCAANFGFEYMRFVEPLLSARHSKEL